MNAKVHELMTESVITTDPHTNIDQLGKLMERNRGTAIPVVDSEGTPIGIVSATDLVAELNGSSPAKTTMTEKIYTATKYDDVSTAARVMRNRKIHRVVVTHEQKVAGVVSAFDLLQLVESHRFVAKNAPTPSKRRGSKRA